METLVENVEVVVDKGFMSLEEKLYYPIKRVRFEEEEVVVEEVVVEEEVVEEEAPYKKKKGSKKGSSSLR